MHLNAQAQIVGGYRLAQGFAEFDLALCVEVEEVLVERLHAVAAGACHQVADFQQFAFENQVLHGRSIEQEVGNGRALAVFLMVRRWPMMPTRFNAKSIKTCWRRSSG